MAVPFLALMSCSDTADQPVDEVVWDATNYVMYNEFMHCTAGEDYSQDVLAEMVSSWRGLNLSDAILGAWGYASKVTAEGSSYNSEWELSWSSKEAADEGWQEWIANDKATAWGKKYSKVLQCDGEAREGYEFIFLYDPYAFGPSPEDGSFAASFSPCTLNDGMNQEDLSNALIKYNSWLDDIDQSQTNGFYAYGIYIPDINTNHTADNDFWFANFHENLQSMNEGNDLWEETGGDAKLQLEAVSTCAAPEISNGQTFYDPTKPDFS